MQVRPYQPQDAPAAVRFFAAVARLDPTVNAVSDGGWREFTSMSFNRGARDFVLAKDGEGLGAFLTSTLLEMSDPAPRHFRILVHPRVRRRGWATRLLRLVEEQDADCRSTLQCNLVGAWEAGRTFLAKEGFFPTRRQLLMEREGPPPPVAAPPPGFCLRSYRGAADDAAWIRLNEEGYGEDPDYTPLTADDLVLFRATARFHLWLAERDGEPCGLCHTMDWQGNRPTVNSVVVTRSARGRGLGRALTTAGVRSALGGDRTKVELNVVADNAPAVAIYRSLGFETRDDFTTWQRPRFGR